MAVLGCGEYTAFIVARGGQTILYQLDQMILVNWERTRDDISDAQAEVSARADCCEKLGALQSAYHELHIYRDDVKVWEGVVVRVEYEWNKVSIFASDILWVAKNTALTVAYNKAYPNIAKGGWVMNWLLTEQTYKKNGDPWQVLPHVHWVQGSDDPSTSAAVKAWSCTTWEDFDKFAEDRGMDYTVVGRDIYFWDTHLRWRTLPGELTSDHVEGGLAIVEYGNEFATRVIVTNGNGYASQAVAPAYAIAKWGYLDHVSTTSSEAAGKDVPTNEEKQAWQEQAQSLLDTMFPAPVRVRVSENSRLVPDAPWGINELIAGAWVQVVADDLCRSVDQWHKIDKISVRAQDGDETVAISTAAAPEKMINP